MPSTDTVRDLYRACTSSEGDVVYEGVAKHTFDKNALETHKSEIEAQVATLNPDMHLACPWVNLCLDLNRDQWGDQPDMERITALGVASGTIIELYREGPIERVLSFPTSPFVTSNEE